MVKKRPHSSIHCVTRVSPLSPVRASTPHRTHTPRGGGGPTRPRCDCCCCRAACSGPPLLLRLLLNLQSIIQYPTILQSNAPVANNPSRTAHHPPFCLPQPPPPHLLPALESMIFTKECAWSRSKWSIVPARGDT